MREPSPLTITSAPLVDPATRALAWAASKVSRVKSAGAFWVSGGSAFWDAWREPGAFTLRLGRLEIIVDLDR